MEERHPTVQCTEIPAPHTNMGRTLILQGFRLFVLYCAGSPLRRAPYDTRHHFLSGDPALLPLLKRSGSTHPSPTALIVCRHPHGHVSHECEHGVISWLLMLLLFRGRIDTKEMSADGL